MGDPPQFFSATLMPHICGPHSQLPNCRYHDQRRQQNREEPTTTWVPIPIHKVQDVTESCPTTPTSTAMPACPATRFNSLSRGALLHRAEVVCLVQCQSSWRPPT